MLNLKEKKWIVVSKDRTIIAKTTGFAEVSDLKSTAAIKTYNSKKLALNSLTGKWFYLLRYTKNPPKNSEDFEVIEVEVTTKEI